MNPVMYILSDPSLEMSAGKLAAQVAHASVEAYRLSCKHPTTREYDGEVIEDWATLTEKAITNRWRRGGHYAKVVLAAAHLEVAKLYIEDRGFKTALIVDEGRTEIDPLTPTALGVEIVDKDSGHVQDTFSAFKLYRERKPAPPTPPEPKQRWGHDCLGRLFLRTD